MVKEFEHAKHAFVSFYYEPHQRELWEVLDILFLRRRVLAAITEKLETRLEAAVQEIFQPTRLSPWCADIIHNTLRSNAWDLFEPIMINYLAYVLPRFDFEERIQPEFYREGLQEFEAYLLASDPT